MDKLCCQHCGLEKEFKFFHSWKSDIKCQACYSKEYKAKYPDKVKMCRENWRKNNNDKVLACNKVSYQLHRENRIAKSLEYQKQNFEKIRQYRASYREKNKEKNTTYQKERYQKNRDEILRKKAEQRKIKLQGIISTNTIPKNKEKNTAYKKDLSQKNRDEILSKKVENRKIKLQGIKYKKPIKRKKEKPIRKPFTTNFLEYLNWEHNIFLETMKKVILRKCDSCGEILATRNFAGKSNTCRKCVDPEQYAVFLQKAREKDARYKQTHPEKTSKFYYQQQKIKNELLGNKSSNFSRESFFMLFSKESFDFSKWAELNGIDLSFIPDFNHNEFLEFIKDENIAASERGKEWYKKYMEKKGDSVREYRRKWYQSKKKEEKL